MRIGMGYQYHDRNIKMINNTRDENKAQKEKQKKKLQEQVPLLCQGVIFCSRWLFNLAIHNVTQCLRPKGKQFETVFRAHIFEHENVKPMKHIMQGQGRSPSNFRLDASLNVLFFFSPKKDLSEAGSTTRHPLCGQAQKGDVTYQKVTQPANLKPSLGAVTIQEVGNCHQETSCPDPCHQVQQQLLPFATLCRDCHRKGFREGFSNQKQGPGEVHFSGN